MKEKKVSKKSVLYDLFGQLTPKIIPQVVNKLVDSIPDGTRVDDFLKNYHQYWGPVADGLSMTIKHLTNLPEVFDHAMAELSAESTKAIVARYGPGGVIYKDEKAKATTEVYTLATLSSYLSAPNLDRFNENLLILNQDQRQKVLNFKVGSPIIVAKEFINNLAQFDPRQFKVWADLYCPQTEPREKSTIEKGLEKGWNEFVVDAQKTADRGGFFSQLAKRKGLI